MDLFNHRGHKGHGEGIGVRHVTSMPFSVTSVTSVKLTRFRGQVISAVRLAGISVFANIGFSLLAVV